MVCLFWSKGWNVIHFMSGNCEKIFDLKWPYLISRIYQQKSFAKLLPNWFIVKMHLSYTSLSVLLALVDWNGFTRLVNLWMNRPKHNKFLSILDILKISILFFSDPIKCWDEKWSWLVSVRFWANFMFERHKHGYKRQYRW